jgi:hypothetical protein
MLNKSPINQNSEEIMNNEKGRFREDVAISIERMMRYCHLAEMAFAFSPGQNKVLPLHLTMHTIWGQIFNVDNIL